MQLANTDSNCAQIKNCGAPEMPQTQCVPITLSGLTDPRVSPQPYNGQFILLELIGATAR